MTHGLPKAGTWNQESRRSGQRGSFPAVSPWAITTPGRSSTERGTERGGDRAPLGDKAAGWRGPRPSQELRELGGPSGVAGDPPQ